MNGNYKMSDAELVREFTKETGNRVPDKPEIMVKEEVYFLVKMLLDEIMELCATVSDPKEAKYNMIKMICESKYIPYEDVNPFEKIALQADALVDMYYYSLNAMAKKGINISKIFKLVHKANMDKCDPETGKFIKREDGKILKPKNWKEPNIVDEIIRQSTSRAFD